MYDFKRVRIYAFDGKIFVATIQPIDKRMYGVSEPYFEFEAGVEPAELGAAVRESLRESYTREPFEHPLDLGMPPNGNTLLSFIGIDRSSPESCVTPLFVRSNSQAHSARSISRRDAVRLAEGTRVSRRLLL